MGTEAELTGDPLRDLVAERLAHSKYEAIFSDWRKALIRLRADPAGAITAARTLLESTSKLVLEEIGIRYEDTWDLPKLYHTASKELGISPAQHTDELLRSIFGASHTIVKCVGELRNKFGDAHGKGNLAISAPRSHAQLAVNLAGSICCFLISCLESTIAAKKLVTPEGNIVLKFDTATVWRLIDHARNSERHISAYDEETAEASLWLVGDSGIYLMSNGDPPIAHTGFLIKEEDNVGIQRLTAKALGCDPDYNAFEDWWPLHNVIDRGSDFIISIPIGTFEEALSSCKSQIVILAAPSDEENFRYGVVSDVEFQESFPQFER